MQKVLRRSLLARNQALRTRRAENKKKLKVSNLTNERMAWQHDRVLNDEIVNERKFRRLEWELGSLAPKRDVGENRNTFGTRPQDLQHPAPIAKSRLEKYINFAVDDRVCVIRGTERGKIGRVLEIDRSSHTIKVSGVNRVDLALHKFQLEDRPGMSPFLPGEIPISIDDVRLVVPMRDAETDEVKETIIKEMYGAGPRIEHPPHSRLPTHTRYVKGLDMPIPWPDEKIYKQPQYQSDTTRYHVEHETFLPSIATHPLPAGAINELRNAYGRSRSDYDEDYVRDKLLQDIKETHRTRQRLVSPSVESWHLQQERKLYQRVDQISRETAVLIEEAKRLSLEKSIL